MEKTKSMNMLIPESLHMRYKIMSFNTKESMKKLALKALIEYAESHQDLSVPPSLPSLPSL